MFVHSSQVEVIAVHQSIHSRSREKQEASSLAGGIEGTERTALQTRNLLYGVEGDHIAEKCLGVV